MLDSHFAKATLAKVKDLQLLTFVKLQLFLFVGVMLFYQSFCMFNAIPLIVRWHECNPSNSSKQQRL